MELVLHQELSIPPSPSSTHITRKVNGSSSVLFQCHVMHQYGRDLFIFAGTDSGDVVYWNWELDKKGKNMNCTRIGRHFGSVLCILFHPVHNLLFTGSTDHSIKVWDPFGIYLPENSCLQTMHGHDKPILTLSYHYDLMISGGADETVRVWKPDPGRKAYKLHPWFQQLKVLSDFGGWVSTLWSSNQGLSGDQGELVVGDMSGTITLYKSIGSRGDRHDVIDFRRISNMRIRKLGITHIIVLYGNNLMITVSYDNSIRFSNSLGTKTYSIIKRPCRVVGISWIAHQEEVVIVDVQGKLDVYQYRKGAIIFSCDAGLDCTHISLHPNSDFVLCSTRNVIQVYRVKRFIPHHDIIEHTESIVGLHLDETLLTNSRLVSAGADNKICLWHVDKFDTVCKQVLVNHGPEISSSLRLCNHNKVHFITGNDRGSVCFWNFEQGKLCSLPIHTNTVSAIIFLEKVGDVATPTSSRSHAPQSELHLPNKKYFVASCSYDGSMALITFQRVYRKPTYIMIENAHSTEIISLIYNKMDDSIISGSNDGKIKVWSTELKLKGAMIGHQRAVTCFALDGYFLFSGSEDNMIIMWNTLLRQKLRSFKMHKAAITNLVSSSDTGVLISTARDGTLLMWDYSSNDILFQYSKENREFTSVTFDYERKDIFLGTATGTIMRVSLNEAVRLELEEQEFKLKRTREETTLKDDEYVYDPYNLDEKIQIFAKKIQSEIDLSGLKFENSTSFNMFQAKRSIEREISMKGLMDSQMLGKSKDEA